MSEKKEHHNRFLCHSNRMQNYNFFFIRQNFFTKIEKKVIHL